MDAADPLDRHHLATQQTRDGGVERRLAPLHAQIIGLEPQLRPTVGTGIGLGVKTAVGGIAIFGGAAGAEVEIAHRGIGAIVGNGLDDRQTRAAVGAVGEGIAVTSIVGIEDFRNTGVAGGRIGRGAGSDRGVGAGDDGKTGGWMSRRQRFALDRVDPRQRRRLAAQIGNQLANGIGRPMQFDQHALAVVAYRSGQTGGMGQPPDKGPEPHALHRSAHANALGKNRRRGGNSGRHAARLPPP